MYDKCIKTPLLCHLRFSGIHIYLGCVHSCSVAQLCPTCCESIDCSLPGSSVTGIFLARILELTAISSSRESSNPGIEPESPVSPALSGRFFITEPAAKPLHLSRALNFFFYFSCWTAANVIWSQDIVDGRKLIVNLSRFSIPWWAIQKENFLYHLS